MEKAIAGLIIAGTILVFGVTLAIPIWLLWNWLMPGIFGLPEINAVQAFGLYVLFSILFKGTGGS